MNKKEEEEESDEKRRSRHSIAGTSLEDILGSTRTGLVDPLVQTGGGECMSYFEEPFLIGKRNKLLQPGSCILNILRDLFH